MVLEFLWRFVCEANIQTMTEAQALIALASFLTGFCRYQAEVKQVSSENGGVTRRPEAERYLLLSYAQNLHISTAMRDLRAVKQ